MKTRHSSLLRRPATLIRLLFFLLAAQYSQTQTLSVATINVWSGLDYRGTFRMGEYESEDQREQRFRMLADELKAVNPDIIALQEANPSGGFACRLAGELGYDYIHQRANAGIKGWKAGIPVNLNEGIAILARKELQLRMTDVWDLSRSFGTFGNIFSFHFSDNNIALVGMITVGTRQIFVINTHLTAAVPNNEKVQAMRKQTAGGDRMDEELRAGAELRLDEVRLLSELIRQYCPSAPVILLGDFNAEPESPEIRLLTDSLRYVDAAMVSGIGDHATWDSKHNSNISYSTRHTDPSASTEMDRLSAAYDTVSRRIDYIFLNGSFRPSDVRHAKIFLKNPSGNIYSSDHYGLTAHISIPPEDIQTERPREAASEFFPIVSYDTDAGFGYGAKAFLLDYAGAEESFDLVLFNSTKGERWYRFVFSMPDFEMRQGTAYSFALDLTIDYDKWISNSFFGIGNRSAFSSREIYTREPLEITAGLSRGATEHSVFQIGLRYKTVKNSNLQPGSRISDPSSPLNTSRASSHSVFAEYRFDSRDSYVNPSRGLVLQGEFEYAPKSSAANVSLKRIGSTMQYYSILFYPKTVFAFRAKWQSLGSENVPVQMLIAVGGNQTLRGSPQDRFLDKTSAVINTEIRFPLTGRLGGVLGLDAGKVWGSPKKMDLERWASNPVAGLRLSMDTFVVRMDLGFGHETTGFYLNFGHLF